LVLFISTPIPLEMWRSGRQQLDLLREDLLARGRRAGQVAAGPGQARDQACTHRIAGIDHHDRHAGCPVARRTDRRGPERDDQLHRDRLERGGDLALALRIASGVARVDRESPAFDPAELSQAGVQHLLGLLRARCRLRPGEQQADPGDVPTRLRENRERLQQAGAGDQRDESSPVHH
jgi:hypothetical protein